MLLYTRVALVTFSVDALHDRLLAAQRHPLEPMGFNPPCGEAQFLWRCVRLQGFVDYRAYQRRVAHPAACAMSLECDRVEGQRIAALVLLDRHVVRHLHRGPLLALHQHLGPAAVQGPGRGIDGTVDPCGSITLTAVGGFMPLPSRMPAAAGYQDLVRTRISTIRMMRTTTPTPSIRAGEPPAGPRRRS
jgi:hypothetical protein